MSGIEALPWEARELPWQRPFGALPAADGTTAFRVWAPAAETVEVALPGRTAALEPVGHGMFEATVAAVSGEDYRYLLDGARSWPDPCSRAQPEGVRGPSRIVDTGAFTWTDGGWEGVPAEALVLYELHVGTFTPAGTFAAAIDRLPELRALGVTAIELMPVATFPGDRNWGYDGVYHFAPHPVYGGPEGLARLVDAAHGEGLAVFLDVVYNHLGPGSEALTAFGPYLTDRYGTPWGEALNFDGPDSEPVREWALQNACLWIRDYHVDGLRLDAVHAIHDEGPRPLLTELARRARDAAPRRRVLVTAESDANDPRLIRPAEAGGMGLDAVWADDFHHALHALSTGERDGYYADFGHVAHLARAFARGFVYDGAYSTVFRRRRGAPAGDRPPSQFVVCAQNHDQVGNRALGDRLPQDARRLAAFWTILSPFVPLLFMGEETGETHPFAFFTDHIDPAIAEATRQGRRREFAAFAAFEGAIPDPQSPETFERSKLGPSTGDPDLRALYADLLRLRSHLAAGVDEVAFSEAPPWLSARRGRHLLIGNFAEAETRLPTTATDVVLATGDARIEDGTIVLAPRSGAVLR